VQHRTGEQADSHLSGIVLTLEGGTAIVAREGTGCADPALTAALDDAFGVVAGVYEERWGRKPGVQELLENLLFVLGGSPARYVRDAAAQHEALQSIRAHLTRQPLAAT
jgi:hypothetical protein